MRYSIIFKDMNGIRVLNSKLDIWEKKEYKHIQLDGFYWVHEAAGKDFSIIPEVKEYLKKKDMKLYWIPYWKAERAEQWASLGFDLAYHRLYRFHSLHCIPNRSSFRAGNRAMSRTLDNQKPSLFYPRNRQLN